MNPGNVTLLKQKQDLLNKSIAETKEKLNTLKSTQAQVQAQFDKGKITEEQFRDFQREIIATENKLQKLEKEAKKFGTVAVQQISAAGGKVEELGNKITDVGQKFKVVSAVASTALVGITAGAINFETAWTGVTKTVDGTEEELEEIKQGIFDLSEATASSAGQIAGVAEAAGQLGVKKENVLAFTETMVRLGDSTNIVAEEAATSIAQLYNVMGSDINTVDRFGSSLVALGNNAATSEADIMNMATRIASAGKYVGLTEQEVLALATSLSSVGLEAEGGGSAISAVITKIDKDVSLNSNTLKTWASVAGMSVKEFKNLWENDAMSAIQAVTKGMGNASAGGENLNVILDELGVTSLRQTDAMKRLSQASGMMSDMVELSNNAWEENTALTEESEKRYQTAEAKIQQLKNTLQELCAKLGEILLPIIKKVSEGLSGFIKWLTGLSPVTQGVILAIIALIAAAAPLLILIGKLTTAVGSIMTNGPKILTALSTIKKGIKSLFAVIAANPVIVIITAIIAAVILLWTKCEWFRNLVTKIFEAIKNSIINTWNNIKKVWDLVQPYFSAIWEGIKASVQPLIDAIIGAFTATWELIKAVWDFVQPYFAAVWEGIKVVWNFAKPYFSAIWEGIKVIFSVVGSVLGGFFRTAWTTIKAVWDTVVGFFAAIWDSIKGIFDAVTSVFHGDFNGAWEAIKGVVGTWVEFFQNLWNNIKNVFASVADFFKNSFSAAWEGIKNIFSNVGNFFKNIWNTIKNMFTNIGTAIGNGIGNAFKTVVNSIINFAENTINKFIRAINGAINLINAIPGVNIPKLKELNIPRLKVGMANVPYDDYLALLHKGERVLTAKENREYGKENEDTKTTTNTYETNLHIDKFYNNREQDVQGIAEELEFYRNKYAMAKGG